MSPRYYNGGGIPAHIPKTTSYVKKDKDDKWVGQLYNIFNVSRTIRRNKLKWLNSKIEAWIIDQLELILRKKWDVESAHERIRSWFVDVLRIRLNKKDKIDIKDIFIGIANEKYSRIVQKKIKKEVKDEKIMELFLRRDTIRPPPPPPPPPTPPPRPPPPPPRPPPPPPRPPPPPQAPRHRATVPRPQNL